MDMRGFNARPYQLARIVCVPHNADAYGVQALRIAPTSFCRHDKQKRMVDSDASTILVLDTYFRGYL